MGSQFDYFNKKMDFVLKEIKELKLENSKILAENKMLSEEISIMKEKIDDLEQINIGNRVEIKGIPKTVNENCIDIVQEIAKTVKSDILIKSAYRIQTTPKNTGIIIADLAASDVRKDFLRKVKMMKINANMISKEWSKDSKIYVNEMLTKNRRILFSKARSICKEKHYKYVWISNAEILVKKEDGAKTRRIKSESDISKL